MPDTSALDSAAKRYLVEVVTEISDHWDPSLGYGWSDAELTRDVVAAMLRSSEYASQLGANALGKWGISGSSVKNSHFAFIGTWASMLDYYYDSYFSTTGKGNAKRDLDKQILWSQQSIDVPQDKQRFRSNVVNKQYADAPSPGKLFTLLRKAYHQDKNAFKEAAWESLINISGPGETIIHSNIRETLTPKDLLALSKADLPELQQDLADIDSYSSILNMAWLEELFTRQRVPILMYNKLNVDELAAMRLAVRHRDTLVDRNFEQLKVKAGGSSPKAVFMLLFREQLEVFYNKVYTAHRRKFINSKELGFHRITSNESTVSRLKAVNNSFECLKISGLLKVNPPDKSRVALTGTGKEVFYLLAKGATPFVCGEYFVLSPFREAAALADKLAAIPFVQKANLERHYAALKDSPSYAALVPANDTPMPFKSVDSKVVARSLFRLTDLPPLAYESLFHW